MFQKGEYIIYSQIGACVVSDITIPDFMKDSGKKYYILTPVHQPGQVFVPVDSDAYMRPIMSKEEALKLIDAFPTITAEACSTSNLQELNQYYSKKLRSNDLETTISLIRSIYEKKQARLQNNQRIGSVDESYMKRAENLVYGELALALGIDRDAVPKFIESRLSAN